MSNLDAAITLGAMLFALLSFATGRSRAVIVGAAILTAACVVQWRVDGSHWRFWPVYLLIFLGCLPWTDRRDGRAVQRWTIRIVQFGAMAVLAACWVFVPSPRLPSPTGHYPVGTAIFRWVDADRPEPATDDRLDRRNIVVQAWYPTTAHARGRSSPYIDGLGRLPDRIAGLPSMLMDRYDRIDTHAVMDAPIDAERPVWPVVLFSPAYGASRSFYTSLLSDLASRGFIVLAVDHPFEAAVVQLADGRIASPIERFLDNDPDRLLYMSRQTSLRAADLDSVLDELGETRTFGRLAGRLDRDRIAAVGHSFGGATAVAIMGSDRRIRAAANIDGTLYGALPEQPLGNRFLLIESDMDETRHSRLYLQGHLRLASRMRAPGYRYAIRRANHYSFTDASLTLSAPARLLAAWLVGGSRGTAETVHATNDLLVEFLDASSSDMAARMAAAAARYPHVSGGSMHDAAVGPARAGEGGGAPGRPAP